MGPLLYAFEANDNPQLPVSSLADGATLLVEPKAKAAFGIKRIEITSPRTKYPLLAIPFYSVGNAGKASYQIWMDRSR